MTVAWSRASDEMVGEFLPSGNAKFGLGLGFRERFASLRRQINRRCFVDVYGSTYPSAAGLHTDFREGGKRKAALSVALRDWLRAANCPESGRVDLD